MVSHRQFWVSPEAHLALRKWSWMPSLWAQEAIRAGSRAGRMACWKTVSHVNMGPNIGLRKKKSVLGTDEKGKKKRCQMIIKMRSRQIQFSLNYFLLLTNNYQKTPAARKQMKLPSKAAVFCSPNDCYKPNNSDCKYITHYAGVCAMGCMCREGSTPSISLKQVSFYLNLTNKLMNDCFGCVFLDLPSEQHNTKGLHEHPGRTPSANKNGSM